MNTQQQLEYCRMMAAFCGGSPKDVVHIPTVHRMEIPLHPQKCFSTARTQVLQHVDTAAYVEGYVFITDCPVPIAHAWHVDAKGRHVDYTRARNKTDKYYGIVVSADEFRERMREPAFVQDFERHNDMFPYLRACRQMQMFTDADVGKL